MATYRKIDCRISNDKKFCELSIEGKLAWFSILSRKDIYPIGACKASLESLAIEQKHEHYINENEPKTQVVLNGSLTESLNGSLPLSLEQSISEGFSKTYFKALNELLNKGLFLYDPVNFIVYVPNFLKYNFPESPNVVKSWETVLDTLPECELTNFAIRRSVHFLIKNQKDTFIEVLPDKFKVIAKDILKAYVKTLGKPSVKTSKKTSNKAYLIQEQEQEQEQEVVEAPPSAPSSAPPNAQKKSKPKQKYSLENISVIAKPDHVTEQTWNDLKLKCFNSQTLITQSFMNNFKTGMKHLNCPLEPLILIFLDHETWNRFNWKWVTEDDINKFIKTDPEPIWMNQNDLIKPPAPSVNKEELGNINEAFKKLAITA